MDWNSAFVAGLCGGLIVKLLDIIHLELRRKFDRTDEATEFLDDQLDPILKAADEVVGKVRALAERDFTTMHHRGPRNPLDLVGSDLAGTLYLIACFWARVEIFRRRGLSIRIRKDPRGRKLQAYFRSLEARKTRLVDRLTQRAVGECMITKAGDSHIGFTEFTRKYENDEEFRRWFEQLANLLSETANGNSRQKILVAGVVMHSMVDTLDSDHQVTNDRPGYGNKLSRKSKAHLRHRVFGLHLKFVRDLRKYLNAEKR